MNATDASPQTPLSAIVNNTDFDQDQKIKAILNLGLKVLGMDIGIVSQINEATRQYTVLYCEPPNAGIKAGAVFDLGLTYCNITMKFPAAVIIPHVAASAYARHPCHKAFKLESYIGHHLGDRHNRYGTINFSSMKPHPVFSIEDGKLIQTMAREVHKLLYT